MPFSAVDFISCRNDFSRFLQMFFFFSGFFSLQHNIFNGIYLDPSYLQLVMHKAVTYIISIELWKEKKENDEEIKRKNREKKFKEWIVRK